MKRNLKGRYVIALASLIMLGTSVVTLSGCSNTQNVTSTAKVVVTGGKNGFVGDKITLKAQVFGLSKQDVTWSSSDAGLATVDESGVVSLLGAGTVRIVATSKENKDVKSSPLTISIFSTEGGVKQLEITSLPTKTYYKIGENISFDGLCVTGYSYLGGVRVNNTGVNFELSDLTFSVKDGTTLSSKGTTTVEVTKEGYGKASFTVEVNDKLVEKFLYISKLPTKCEYLIGNDATEDEQTFDPTGLEVREVTYEEGVKKSEVRTSDYDLSVKKGEKFIVEGSQEIVVSKDGFDDASFTVMVYTKDMTIYNTIKTLQTAMNFQVEVLNNVGTTRDSYGFHYLRTYTENYYDEIEYQNTYNSTTQQIEFTTDKIKSHTGFASYKTGDEYGVLQYEENAIGRLQFASYVSEGMSSWWERASTLATLFTVFDLNELPVNTLNGKYVVTTINQVDGDDEMGTKTIANYPLVEQFLSYCGWSSSLITIMDRFTVSINADGQLSMLASFGYYGSTELKVLKIGGASNASVEKILNSTGFTPSKVILPEVEDIKDKFKANNYKRFEYGSDGVTSNATDIYNPNYYYNVSTRSGFIKLSDGIYNFKGVRSGSTYVVQLGDKVLDDAETVPEYMSSSSTSALGYVYYGLSGIFGGDNDSGKLYTYSVFSSFSTDLQVCYQSFDTSVLDNLVSYFGQTVEDGRAWFIASYTDKSHTADSLTNVEIWNISFTGSGGSGFVGAYGDFGNASLDWVESYLASNN